MIVDAHAHLWNRVHGRIAGETPVTSKGNGKIRVGEEIMLGMPACLLDCQALADFLVAEMDAAGVDAAVIVQEYLDGEQNDYLLETISRFPDRFFMHGLPNFFCAETLPQQVSALLDCGFRGIKLPAGHLAGKVALDDERLMPAYGMLESVGGVLAVDLSEGQDEVSMMQHILAAYPQLKVALGHFGMPNRGGWPGQLELCRHPNVHIEMGGIVWLYRDEGYPFGSAIKAVRRAIEMVGIDKIMWGSDWPRTMVDFTYRQSLDFLRWSEAFTSDENDLMLGGNAMRLYGFSLPSTTKELLPRITEG